MQLSDTKSDLNLYKQGSPPKSEFVALMLHVVLLIHNDVTTEVEDAAIQDPAEYIEQSNPDQEGVPNDATRTLEKFTPHDKLRVEPSFAYPQTAVVEE